MSSMAEKVSLG